MMMGKLPSISVQNGLQLTTIEKGCHLTELENNLIALNINFQYIFCLQKSRWAGTKKQMISVPVTPETVKETVQQLPRIPRDAGLVEVKLKRKQIYDGCHKKEYIDPLKLLRVLRILQTSGHPYYQFLLYDLKEYEKRCRQQDAKGHQLIFGNETLNKKAGIGTNEQINDSSATKKTNCEDVSIEEDEEEEEKRENDYITKDPIRKHQFDHNRNTCMTSNYPEIFCDENGRKITSELSFAPAEGNTPYNLLNERTGTLKVGLPFILMENSDFIMKEKGDSQTNSTFVKEF